MSDWIGTTFTSETGWNHLETLVDIGDRMAGTDGERAAAEATRDVLEEIGARDAHLEAFDIQGWTRGSSTITADGDQYDCIALPRSPDAEATGELVDLSYGLPRDFEGRDLEGAVVMAASNVPDWYDRFLHRREKYYHAVEAGAAAFIFRNHVEGCLAPTGSVGTPDDPIGDIPAVGVSKEVGTRLARRAAGEEVTMEVQANIHPAQSQNVHADIGPDTDEAVLLTSHVDAHDIAEGAEDNGAGTAVVLEVARALKARENELNTRVHVIVFGAEEVGLCGSTWDRDQRDPKGIKAIVNNDVVARGRTLKCYSHSFDALEEAIETVADRFDHPIEMTPELGPHSDHWPYVQRGIPGIQAASVTEDEGRGWGHTRADTLDKLEPRVIREQSILVTELVAELAGDHVTVERRDPDDIAEQLEEEDLAQGMKIIGDWPY